MAHEFIYSCYKLARFYPPDKTVLENISLSFYPGAKIGVIGSNGAGINIGYLNLPSVFRFDGFVDEVEAFVVEAGDGSFPRLLVERRAARWGEEAVPHLLRLLEESRDSAASQRLPDPGDSEGGMSENPHDEEGPGLSPERREELRVRQRGPGVEAGANQDVSRILELSGLIGVAPTISARESVGSALAGRSELVG